MSTAQRSQRHAKPLTVFQSNTTKAAELGNLLHVQIRRLRRIGSSTVKKRVDEVQTGLNGDDHAYTTIT